MNDTKKIQSNFYKYIVVDDDKKDNVIKMCISQCPNQLRLINRIKYIVDNLSKDNKMKFINNVFDVKNDTIYEDLIENMESQIQNKTTTIEVVKTKEVTIISYDDFDKKELVIPYDKLLESRKLTEKEENDTRVSNNIIERLLNFNYDKLGFVSNDNKEFITSIYELPETSEHKIVKEDSLCDTREIQYLFDRIIGEKDNKKEYINRIYLDLITNQNYRILANGFGTLNSDLTQNDYYSIDGVSVKKDVAFESLYRNYQVETKEITDLIIDNYNQIMKLIEDTQRLKTDIDKNYIDYLKKNIVNVYEKAKISKALDAIEFGTNVDVFDNKRKTKNEIVERNLNVLRDTLNLKQMTLSRTGYSNILILVAGTIIFGILFAYLMIKI